MKRPSPQITGYITEFEQATRSGITIDTLRKWRGKGYGPQSTKFGRRVLYAEDANQKFLAEQAAEAEARRLPRRSGRPRLQRSEPSGPPPVAALAAE